MAGESTLIVAVRSATQALTAALAAYEAANAPAPTPAPPPPAAPVYRLILVGDSRLNGDWNALLGRNDILNLSVAGTKASDWLANWSANCQAIRDSGAKKVIVQFGKNDVDAGKTPAVIAHEIQDIVSLIGTYTSARVGVLGPLPVSANSQNAAYINQQINQLQGAIPPKVAAASPTGVWHQGFQTLVNSSDQLIPTYTDDGSHLNAAGREIYKSSIPALEALIPSSP